MRQRVWHSTVVLLLLSYLLIGIVGHLEALTLLGFGIDLQHILGSKGGPQPTVKVYWTQYKHIPTTIKISVPSPAVLAAPDVPQVRMHGAIIDLETDNIQFDPVILLHSSRAPPQV